MLSKLLCVISLVLKLWQPTACLMLIIILLTADAHHTVRAVAEALTASDPAPSPLGNQAFGEDNKCHTPSTIFFTQNKSLSCDTKERVPGHITTTFLYSPPYAFGCLSHDTSSYYFSVALLLINFPNTPIWIANRQYPVTENASLSLSRQGVLLLQDSDNQVWSSGQGSSNSNSNSKPAGLLLTCQGNLILFDDQNITIWESFSEPVDLLVPGQFLNPGSRLVAGFSSSASLTGNFVAAMEPGGLILYENSTSVPLPYYALRYPLTPTNVTDVLHSPCNRTQLQLNETMLTLVQVSYTPACIAPESAVSFGSPVAFIRLEPNGVLKGYYPDHKPSYDLFHNSSKGLCGIPNVCGPYGICEDSKCVCASGNDSVTEYFVNGSQDFLLSMILCTPKVEVPTCEEGNTTDQYFLDLERVDYFANDFIAATLLTKNFDQCKVACATNCTCQAAFYRADANECYLHEKVMSMMRVEHKSYVATIKVGKESSSSSGTSETGLIVGISVGLIISVILFGVWYIRHKPHRRKHLRFFKEDEDDQFSSLPGQAQRFTFKELQRVTQEFSEKLGAGGFGSVYRGVFTDGTIVAVKQLENTTRFTQGMKEFRNEVFALSNINHQNLVHLRGFCADGVHRLLVYEYVPNGSLDVWLFRKGAERPGPPLDWKTRLAIAVYVARGLVFLHEQCRNRIVHLDIKPQNILLDQQFIPKLSDFGLSRLINEDDDMAVSRMRGTPGYMAPECLIISDANEKSDVYSFGMVLLEILSGRKNVDVSRLVVHGDAEGWYFPAMAVQKFSEGNAMEIIDKSLGKLGSEQVAEATRMIKIAFWCIQEDPSLRPTMGRALLMLEGYSRVAEPPLSNHYGMHLHFPNSFATSSGTQQQGTPKNNFSPRRSFENRDRHLHERESKVKIKDQQNRGEKGESQGLASKNTLSLSSLLASPRASAARMSPFPNAVPGSDVHQSPSRQSLSPNIPSPCNSHRASSVSSPRRNAVHFPSPLSHKSASPFQGDRSPPGYLSSTPSTYHSPTFSPRNV